MSKRVIGSALLVLAMFPLTGGTATELHLRLVKAEPAVDATVTSAPAEVRLYFSQEPEIRATRLTITDAASNEVTLAAAKAVAGDGKIVFAPITGTVVPGSYTVTWKTMAKDGHAVNGTFKFTYRADP